MTCPNCGNELSKRPLTNTIVNHCSNCGCTLFDENDINRISLKEAKDLASQKINDSISGEEKLCPKDHSPLKTLRSDAIPNFVTMLNCTKCGSILAYPDDLINFKKAQSAKLNYYKTWQIPVPSVRAMLVFGFVLSFSFAITAFMSPLFNPPKSIKAISSVCPMDIAMVGDNLLVSCLSKYEFPSHLKIVNKMSDIPIIKRVNIQPRKYHIISIPKEELLDLNQICFQMVMESDHQEFSTPCMSYTAP